MTVTHILCAGRVMIDLLSVVQNYPAENTEAEVVELAIAVGGTVGRSAVCCSRLGASVSLAGMVGTGVFADLLQGELAEDHLNISMFTDYSAPTSQHSIVVISRSTGQRTILWSKEPPPSEALCDHACASLHGCDTLVIDGTEAYLSRQLAIKAESLRVPAIIDTGSYKDHIEQVLPHVPYIVGPRKFFEKRAERRNRTIAAELIGLKEEMDAEVVVMTCGQEGGQFTEKGRSQIGEYQAFPTQAIDTCGAGDTFHGAFAFGIARGWPAKQCVIFGSWAAGRKCAGLGNQMLPTARDIDEWAQFGGV